MHTIVKSIYFYLYIQFCSPSAHLLLKSNIYTFDNFGHNSSNMLLVADFHMVIPKPAALLYPIHNCPSWLKFLPLFSSPSRHSIAPFIFWPLDYHQRKCPPLLTTAVSWGGFKLFSNLSSFLSVFTFKASFFGQALCYLHWYHFTRVESKFCLTALLWCSKQLLLFDKLNTWV